MEISKLHEAVRELVIIEPSADSTEVVNGSQLAPLQAAKAALVAQGMAMKIDSPESFALASEWIDGCDAFVDAVAMKLDKPIDEANARHKAFTGMRGALVKDIKVLADYFRSARGEFKIATERAEREAKEKAQREAQAAAEAAQREQARLAQIEAKRIADEAAEVKRLADLEAKRIADEAAEAKRLADAEAARLAAEAAEIVDPDLAMEAAAAAEEAAAAALQAEADAAELARQTALEAERVAEEARIAAAALAAEAEAAAAMPVVVPTVHVEPVLAKEDGVSWADNWVAEYDEPTALRAMVAAGAVEYLMVNPKAVNAAAKSQKSLARIPGVSVVNKKIERRK